MSWQPQVCIDVAPQSETPLTTTGLRLVAQVFKAPPERGDPAETSVEKLMSGVTMQILEHGYVLVLETGASGKRLAPSTGRMTLARTTRDGTIVKIEEEEIDGSPSEDKSKELKFTPGHEYTCFWTFANRKKLFRDVLAAVRKDAVGAIKTHPFFIFQVAPTAYSYDRVKHLRRFLDVDRTNPGRPHARADALAALMFHDAAGRFGDAVVHGVFSGGGNLWAELACAAQKPKGPPPDAPPDGKGTITKPTDDEPPADDWESGLLRSVGVLGRLDPKAAYVIARADCIAAMYVAEILCLESERSRRRVFEDWTVFEGVRNMCLHAQQGSRSKALEKSLGGAEAAYDEGGRYDEWRRYAFKCAQKDIDRKTFVDAIDEHHIHKWTPAVKKIGAKVLDAPHPLIKGARVLKTTGEERNAALGYFDYYVFAKKQPRETWWNATKRDLDTSESYLDQLGTRVTSFLRARAPYHLYGKDLDAHMARATDPKERGQLFKEREALLLRYLATAVHVGYKWWLDIPVSDDAWTAFQKYIEWGENIVGTSADNFGAILAKHFDYEGALKYNAMLRESATEFESLWKAMEQYGERLHTTTVRSELSNGAILTADFEKKVFVLHYSEGTGLGMKRKDIGPIHFSRRPGPLGGTAPDYHLPFKGEHRWPSFLAAFGDFVSLSLAINNFSADLAKNGFDAVGKLTMNAFQAVSSVGEAIRFMSRSPVKPGWAMEFVGVAGTLLEAFYNVKDGMTILFDCDESEAMKAVDDGDIEKGWVLFSKGMVLVASVTPGVASFSVALASGAAVAAAMTPLGVGLAVGAIIVLGIDMWVRHHDGPDNIMDPTKKKLQKAAERQGYGPHFENLHGVTCDSTIELVEQARLTLRACDGIQ